MLISFILLQENSNGFDTIITHDLFESFVLSMSPAQHSDEDFIALVRNLFTFTALKPPPPQYKMSHGGQNAATPTAKQVFGDFISWNQTESIKEKNQAVRVTRNVRTVFFLCGVSCCGVEARMRS